MGFSYFFKIILDGISFYSLILHSVLVIEFLYPGSRMIENRSGFARQAVYRHDDRLKAGAVDGGPNRVV